MRLFLIITALALAAALAWGFYAQSQPAAARAQDMVAPITDAWRAALPRDPEAATQAFLDRVPQEMRDRGEAVSQTRYWIYAARLVATFGALILFVASGAAAALSASAARITKRRWIHDMLFTAALFALLLCIAMPVNVYAGYVRLRQFGFADRPFLDWLQDTMINWAVLTAFYVVGIAAFMALMRRARQTWPAWAAAIYLAFAGAYVLAMPTLIEPLTNHYTALPDSPLKHDILAMARANDVPADNVYTSNASRQSRLLNAHVSGVFGTARISIDDTTLSGQDRAGVLAVVGHEIGHYVMGHIYWGLLLGSIGAGVGFALIARLGPALISRYGAAWRIGDFTETAGIAVFWLLFVALSTIAQPIDSAVSRWDEHQADLYGLNASQAPEGMAEFMIHDADTARLSPTPLDIILFYDHPSDRARVETAMRWRAEHMDDAAPTSNAPSR